MENLVSRQVTTSQLSTHAYGNYLSEIMIFRKEIIQILEIGLFVWKEQQQLRHVNTQHKYSNNFLLSTDDLAYQWIALNTYYIAAIITGLKALLGRFDRELIKREKEAQYLSERDQGDPNYFLSVFLPCLICKFDVKYTKYEDCKG